MSDKPQFDLEAEYDAEIAPLMEQIIAVCKRHKMPCLCTFQYRAGEDRPEFCTTALGLNMAAPEMKAARVLIQDGLSLVGAFRASRAK